MSVTSDTNSVTSAIQQFVTDYNSVQSFISAQQLVTTASNGTVTPGTLTADQTSAQLIWRQFGHQFKGLAIFFQACAISFPAALVAFNL